jgi:hypothetical protein
MPSYLVSAGFQADSITAGTVAAAAVEKLGLGIRVDRATSDLPATTSTAMFTVTGYCIVYQFLGLVTTVVQTQACNYSLESNPTATGANVALCGVLNISALAVGTLLGVTGTLATAMTSGLAIIGQVTPLVVQAGTIEAKTSATNTGQVAWSCWYAPLSAGASIVAA